MHAADTHRVLMLEAIEALDRSQARIRQLETGGGEPIAIVGMGCRFPGGVATPDDYWRLLEDGVCAVGRIPAERWDADQYFSPDPDTPGAMCTRHGGFMAGIDQFEPEFFGISPREAASMDPQQRLLLEVSWEALEDAGLASLDRDGVPTGVFVGLTAFDYASRLLGSGGDGVDAYFSSGNLHNAAAGRIAYALGLQGPSLAVDTACSSSLVAVHLACQSLRAGECGVALAGGVNAILNPEGMIATSRAHMLSPEGLCKTFDAEADGYVRGEGCGIVVLERLSQALSRRRRIWGVIRGSAVNQNGAGSGLTVPSGPAQERLIRSALAQAGVGPDEVDYVEAHGTGTRLGDPVEVNALAKVFGGDRRTPLLAGSVKTNLGHLESAAGVAGLIKVVLALRREAIPAHLHLRRPNPLVAWSEIQIDIPRETRSWPKTDRPRIAGVSAFGFSGANAHLVVAEAPDPPPAAPDTGPPRHLLALSAPTPHRLAEAARAWRQGLEAHPAAPADLCFSALSGRAHFPHRAYVTGESLDELQAGLCAIAERPGEGPPVRHPPRIGFLFTGQGSQQPGMGRDLYERSPTFRAAMDACFDAFRPHLDRDLKEILYGDGEVARLVHQTAYAQPALFTLAYGLVQFWRALGVQPDVAIGHSLGELSAACAAEVIGLEDAARLVALRGRLMQALPTSGVMAAVRAPVERILQALAPYRDTVSIAAFNGPEDLVVSGLARDVEAVEADLAGGGIRTRRLETSAAFHSPLMAPIVAEFEAAVRTATLHRPQIAVVSCLAGALANEDLARPEHWSRHILDPVDFAGGMRRLAAEDCDVLVEIGPAPVLIAMARGLGLCSGADWLPSLRPSQPDWRQILESLGKLYVRGARIDADGLYPPGSARRADLPPTAFRRARYWVDPPASPPAATSDGRGPANIGARMTLAGSREIRFSAAYRAERPAYLDDHRLGGDMVVPAASHISAVLGALAETTVSAGGVSLENLLFPAMMRLADDETLPVQIVLQDDPGRFEVYGAGPPDAADPWIRHAHGGYAAGAAAANAAGSPAPPQRDPDLAEGPFYDAFRAAGYTLGPAFRWIDAIWLEGDEAICRLVQPDLAEDPGQYPIHPGLLDSCFQVLAAFPDAQAALAAADATLLVPFHIERLAFDRAARGRIFWCRLRRQPSSTGVAGADLQLFDEAAARLLDIQGFEARPVERSALTASPADPAEISYEMTWRPASQPAAGRRCDDATWLVVGDRLGEELAAELRRRGARCTTAPAGAVDPGLLGKLVRTGSDVVCVLEDDPCTAASLDATEAAVARSYALVLGLVQQLASAAAGGTLTLAVRGDHPAAAAAWALAKVASQEHPDLRIVCVELDPADPDGQAASLVEELLSDREEAEIAFRDGARQVRRLVRRRTAAGAFKADPGAAYLITGGLGSLGLRTARWLVAAAGARRIVLAGRRAERSPEVDAAIAEIAGLGAELATEAADVSDARAVADLLARIQARGWALRGVFHAAGTLDDGPLASQTPARFAAVLAPKLAGAWRLAEACPDLDAFVAFSSAAAWLGPPGQGPYAAANAALDAFMRRRRGHGLPALTVNWGPWAGAGMASGLSGRQRSRLDARGVRRLSDAQALGGLGRALSAGLDQLAIIDADWPGVRLAGGARLLDELGPAATPAAAVGSLKQAVRMAEPARRRAVLEARLVELVAQVLGFTGPAALRIDVHAGLFDIGLDSLSALELRNALQTELAAPLSATLAFRHPTIAELADGLLPLAGGAAEPLAPSPDEAVATRIAGEVAALTEAELESMIDFEYRRLTTR